MDKTRKKLNVNVDEIVDNIDKPPPQ